MMLLMTAVCASDVGGQVEQAHGVGHGGPALAYAARDLGLGQAKLVDELLVGQGFFQGVQVGALDVLDEGDFQHGLGGGLFDDDGQFGEAGALAGAPAALAGNEGVLAAAGVVDNEGLDEAVFADGVGQFLQRFFVHMAARLVGVGADGVDGDDAQPGRAGRVAV
jgi:hypothetical protein